MGRYTEIQSEFIRDRIKEMRWKDRSYINMLCPIAEFMTKSGSGSFVEGMPYHLYQHDSSRGSEAAEWARTD